MMKKFMMIGLVVFGGVQGIHAAALSAAWKARFAGLNKYQVRQEAATQTQSFLNFLHQNYHAPRMKKRDLVTQVAVARQSDKAREIEHRNSQFYNVNQPSPRSWIKPQARHVKLKGTLTRDPLQHLKTSPDIAAMFA